MMMNLFHLIVNKSPADFADPESYRDHRRKKCDLHPVIGSRLIRMRDLRAKKTFTSIPL
ncbi:hypothetical protein NIASO_00545 [Niabella soli DSM 19437]|uniref:Uncharacterized protein n=1 Tax=Niabella soli DSM 19437 TaxID=929713 RepID=W0F5C8_9BACT|nr:hypothetical protein NIASO_00545 [Niabella soli DSM 19437]